jgi:hypothetical protein
MNSECRRKEFLSIIQKALTAKVAKKRKDRYNSLTLSSVIDLASFVIRYSAVQNISRMAAILDI